MQKLILTLAILLTTACETHPTVTPDADATAPLPQADAGDAGEAPEVDAAPPGQQTQDVVNPKPLADYLAASMQAWRKGDSSFYADVAFDIAAVVLSEPPVWKSDINHARTATLLASLAFFEGGLQPWVDATYTNGCNDFVWRQSAVGRRTMLSADCDGGFAVSLFQIHVEQPMALVRNAGWRWARGADLGDSPEAGVTVIHPHDLANRQVATRVALHMARESIEMTGGLMNYSGESGAAPKARARLSFAENWVLRHPFNP